MYSFFVKLPVNFLVFKIYIFTSIYNFAKFEQIINLNFYFFKFQNVESD